MDEFINLLFNGTVRQVQERLQPMSSDERAAAFKPIKTVLEALRSMFKDDNERRRKKMSLGEVRRLFDDDVKGFLDRWKTLKKQAPVIWDNHRYDECCLLFTRVQCLQVGLAPSKTAAGQGLKLSWDSPVDHTYLLDVGRVLLDRPEAWRQEMFFRFVDNLWRSEADIEGLPRLLQEAKSREPDWREEILERAGRAMDWKLVDKNFVDNYDQEMVFAGLEYVDPETPTNSSVAHKHCVGNVRRLANAGKLDRQALTATTRSRSPPTAKRRRSR